MMHMMTVASARPPGRRRVQMWIASNSLSAMPECSSIAPMNTNSGTAAKHEVGRDVLDLLDELEDRPGRRTSTRPNSTAVIIMQKATGKPRNISVKATGSIRNGR